MNKPKRNPSGWEDISDVLTHQGMMTLKTGQTLTFEGDKGTVHLRIMRMTPYKCWAKRVKLYHPKEIQVIDRSELDKLQGDVNQASQA